MKKIYLVFKLMLVLGIIIVSCKKEYTPSDAVSDQIKVSDNAMKDSLTRDSLRRLGGVINYSINIVDGSDAGFSSANGLKSAKSVNKTAAITGAKVVAEQYGKTIVVTDTAGNGIVTIKDLRIGTVSVRIQATGFTECSFIAQLTPMGSADTVISRTTNSDIWNTQRYVGTMVPLFPTTGSKMATVSGVMTYQSDLTNVGREKAANVGVFGVIDVNNTDFIDKYMASYEHIDIFGGSINQIQYYGHIVKIAYNSIVFSATTDAAGAFSVQVPATGDGLPIRLEVSDLAVDQSILLDTLNNVEVHGVQTVRTLFSSNYTPSPVPFIPAAYCTFSAPSGAGTLNEPTTAATATAVISESGIISITTSNPGLGYTQAPKVVITGTAVINPASASAVLDADGRVNDITVDVPGLGYTAATVTISGSETTTATATPIVTYSVEKVTMTTAGTYAAATPPTVNIYSNTGTGATATAVMSGSLASIAVTSGGTGYGATAPLVVITGGGTPTVPATATATVVAGIVTLITITNAGSGYTSTPTVTLQPVGGNPTTSAVLGAVILSYSVAGIIINNAGSGYRSGDAFVTFSATAPDVAATGTVSLTKGVLSNLVVANPGAGYTAAPNVIITVGGAAVNALATATIANGQVTGFTISNPGIGYTGNPTVTISTYKTAATATALCHSMAGKIIGINLTANGEGYNVAPIVEFYYNTTVTGNGNGTNAAATATISGGRVTDVTITNGGSGYYTAPLVRFRMPNLNQTAKAHLTISKDGYVTGITLDNSGWGYDVIPTITITPSVPAMGSGATAIVTKMDNSQVTAVKIVNQGTGYLGKNNPAAAESFSIITAGGSGATTINSIQSLTGKTYIRDIYLGTGQRTVTH